MANYLKGIGDAGLRVNEILPILDARINKFIIGHTAGIIKNELNEFAAQTIDRGVVIRSGLLQAHGFFASADTDTQFNFVMPATTQYVQIYAEIDLSVVPNRFAVKTTAMSATTVFSPQQDNLRTTTNGKYQTHLWQATLTATTVTLTDKRTFIYKPSDAVTAENFTTGGGIATQLNLKAPLASPSLTGTPTAPTAAQSVNSTQIATTAYTRTAVANLRSDILDNLKNTPLLNAPWSYDITTTTGSTRIYLANAINFNTDFVYLSTTNKLNGDEKYIVKKYLPINGGVLCSFDTSAGLVATVYIRLVVVSSTAIDLEWHNLYNSSMTGWNYRGVFELQYIGASHWER